MNELPKISIITAFYNEDPVLLKKCIESVLNEDYENIEFILIDDNPDGDRVSSFNDPRIKYIKNSSNIGLTKSLNKGLKISTGKYVARLDSNDFNINNRLFEQVKFLEKNPSIGFCGTRYEEIFEDQVIKPRVEFCSSDLEIRQKFGRLNPFAHSTLMFRRDLLLAVGGYSNFYYYSQDYDLTYRLLKITKAVNLNEIYVRRHISSKDISRKKYKKQLFYAFLVKVRNLFFPLSFKISNILSVLRTILVLMAPKAVIDLYKKVRFGYV